MEVEFMVTDSFEAIRPKLVLLKNIEDAATAVDEIFASTVQGSGREYSHFQFTHVTLILSQLAERAVVMIAVTRVNALLMMTMTKRRRMRTIMALSIRW
jgi:hypothetical protein